MMMPCHLFCLKGDTVKLHNIEHDILISGECVEFLYQSVRNGTQSSVR